AAAIAASTDPLIVLARQAWPMRRALRLRAENEVDTPVRRAAEAIDQARFALYGHDVPPDATNTLRLSFGPAKGYVSNGLTHPWKTTWGGWWDRADSFDQREPFKLPASIDRARGKVPASTPLDFVLTADIIGGNSGSPVVNAQGELVGLIFDGNLEGLGGSYAYQDHTARAIAVHADAIMAALEKVYGAGHLAREMRGR
ncbi:MAG: S46 family peptidase, partial [Burkholderiales bacterium]|nr:S46 family peptidase [Burkholderiales bacterium]